MKNRSLLRLALAASMFVAVSPLAAQMEAAPASGDAMAQTAPVEPVAPVAEPAAPVAVEPAAVMPVAPPPVEPVAAPVPEAPIAEAPVSESTSESSAAESPLRQGSYVAPMFSYVLSQDDELDNGYGGQLTLGYRQDFWAIEIGGIYTALSGGSGDPTYKGATINGLLFPFSSLPNLYGLIGAGGLEITDYPTKLSGSFSTTTAQAGAGYLFRFVAGRYEFGVRAEALYRRAFRDRRVNAQYQDLDVPRHLDDVLINIGLQLPIGLLPPPPPPPEPVKVVAVEEPADSDHDGVIDSLDQCPGTEAGVIVDEKGCPIPKCEKPKPGDRISLAGCKAGDVIVLNGVNFEFDKARLTPNAKTILDQVADELTSRPDIHVEIGGHTDSRGSDAYNQRLSEERAKSVVAYLAERGIAAERMSEHGYGESQPVADNETDEGRELNRRVELKIVDQAGEGSTAEVSAPAVTAEPAVADATGLQAY